MKRALLLAAASAALAPGAAEAAAVRLQNVAAVVTVVPENRTDVAVEIRPGSGAIAAPKLSRSGANVFVVGELPARMEGCAGFRPGATRGTVRLKGRPNVAVKDLPALVIRTPMDVDLTVEGGVSGTIGQARSVRLRTERCGAWRAAGTTGDFDARLDGATDLVVGRTGTLSVSLDGMGEVKGGPTRGLVARLDGMGDLEVEALDGPADLSIDGMGGVKIAGGRATTFKAALSGMGGVRFDGVAGSLDASVDGMGQVRVAEVTGPVTRRVSGVGRVKVGR